MPPHTGLVQYSHNANQTAAYASRVMSTTEQRYAQVEKEALVVTWACEKFADYVIGMRISLNTDHKPLVPLLGSMNLDQLPPSIQRF